MLGKPWTQAEVDYVVKRAVEDGQRLQEVAGEMVKVFGTPRTYDGVITALRNRSIKISDLRLKIRESQVDEVVAANGGAVPKPPEGNGIPIVRQMTEEEMRKQLSGLGYKVEKLSEDKTDRKFKIDNSLLFTGEKLAFAVISCTQIGSKYQQMTHLRSFYQYIQERGIKTVLHLGDLVDGIEVYDGHEYELFLHGENAQGDYCVENYPHMENGGKTFVIAGNHDYSFMKVAGCDILKRISEKREDIMYLGAFGAYPVMPMLRVYMQHGGGGGAYARSYKMQKYIEQMAPEAKPDLYFLGHYHSTCALFEYRNVTAFMLGCFQSQTPHERRHGLYPELGGLIVEVTVNDKTRKHTLADFKFEWVPFYIPIENDY